MKLKQRRDAIDEIDRQIIGLLEKRFEIVADIAKLKESQGLEIEDGAREADVLKNWMSATHKIEPKFLKKVVGLVMDYSKSIQVKANKCRRRRI